MSEKTSGLTDAEFERKYRAAVKKGLKSYEIAIELDYGSYRSVSRRVQDLEKRTGLNFPRPSSQKFQVERREEAWKLIRDERTKAKEAEEKLDVVIKELELYRALDKLPPAPPEWMTEVPKKDEDLGVPTLFLTDLHWDEIVRSAQVGGVNEYNREIAERRLRTVFETTRNILLHEFSRSSYPGMVIPMGGDNFAGLIHEELREAVSAPIIDSIFNLRDNLIAGYKMLAEEVGPLFIPCVVGNHGRIDRKPRAKNGVQDNFDYLLYRMLEDYFKDDKNVTVLVSQHFDAWWQVFSHRFLLTHGDQFRGGSGISGPLTPWMLGDHRKRKRQQAINQPYDTLLFGHWHSLTWGPGDTWICGDTLKGYDEYAMRNNFPYGPPQQALFLTHQNYGITYRLGIHADKTPQVIEDRSTPWFTTESSIKVSV